jgi:hypothetical protein
VPIYVYHSRDDPQVDFPVNEFAVKELTKLQAAHGGYAHHFDAVDGKGHAFPDPKPAVEFVQKHARDPRPKKFLWQPFRPWKKTFYWLSWDEPDPAATILAEIAAPNSIALRVEGVQGDVKGLTVLLDDRMGNLDKEWTVTLNGAEKFRGSVRRSLPVLARSAVERRDPEMLFVASIRL